MARAGWATTICAQASRSICRGTSRAAARVDRASLVVVGSATKDKSPGLASASPATPETARSGGPISVPFAKAATWPTVTENSGMGRFPNRGGYGRFGDSLGIGVREPGLQMIVLDLRVLLDREAQRLKEILPRQAVVHDLVQPDR